MRSVLSRRGTRATGAPRKPHQGTKEEVVLAMLRRPEGATVAQIAERIRQVSPNKQGAAGCYTIYRISNQQMAASTISRDLWLFHHCPGNHL
jgi:hypothetical protein